VTIDQMVGACDQMRRRPAPKTKQRPEPEGTRPLFRRRAGANVPTRTLGSHTREPLS
jgi:hypothetical protein